MGYVGKVVPKTHTEHLAALVKLNLFEDKRIEASLARIVKSDFCTRKPQIQKRYERASDKPDFNPFSLDPQAIGQG